MNTLSLILMTAITTSTQSAQEIDPGTLDDGPYVFWTAPDAVEVITHVDGTVERQLIKDLDEPRTLTTSIDGVPSIRLDPTPPSAPTGC